MFDFIKNEHEVLALWSKKGVLAQMKSRGSNAKDLYRTLDGPITANGSMGIHHAWGRTLKDALIKYNTMQGRKTHFQNGFDAQGMWVEVEVEKHLGLSDKKAIAQYGLDNFTEKCIERVNHFSKIQTNQSIRLGQIMDWENSYFTNSDHNIECIWNFLKVCHERGMIKQSYKAMPWCPRCGTSLSEHEMAGQYKDNTHNAVVVKVKTETGEYINIWTTTPWTLPANVAIAVNPKDKRWAHLIGKTYEPIFSDLKVQQFEHKIIPWEEVSMEEGTGAVHIAPGCGAEDFGLGQKHKLRNIIPVDDGGVFTQEFEYLAGKNTVNCEEIVFKRLENMGKIVKIHPHTHAYPFCWRCKTNVIFKLVGGWDIAVDSVRKDLIKAAKTVKWEPEYLGKTMQDWLENMGDWNISRRRFYGLPLPFYVCSCGHVHVIGSKKELLSLAVGGGAGGNAPLPHLHRPYIDEIEIKCPKCGKPIKRVTDVGDCWLDAGIAPFSTMAKEYMPSQVVIEMKEQVRLWFYSQLFMSVVLTGKAPYERVIGYGTVLDENGGKFSKSGKNNIVFDEAAERFGSDAIRYLYAGGNPSNDIRFGATLIEEARRKMLAIFNAFTFYNTYYKIDKPNIPIERPEITDATDKWLLSATNELISKTTNAYENYHMHEVIELAEEFVEDLSNFYIRTNRRRFWKGGVTGGNAPSDKANAYFCLYNAIRTLTLIMAPITPFMCEHIWQQIRREDDAELVVAANFPKCGAFPPEPPLRKLPNGTENTILQQVRFVKRVISNALSLRSRENLKLRQPLSVMYVIANEKSDKIAVDAFRGVLSAEANVRRTECLDTAERFNLPLLAVNFKRAGAVLKERVQLLKQTLANLTDSGMEKAVSGFKKGSVTIGDFKNLPADVFELKQKPRAEFVSFVDGDLTVVIDTTLTPDLVEECILRELIRAIQVARQTADLEITARIKLEIKTADARTRMVIEKFKEKICEEVLAVSLNGGAISGAGHFGTKSDIEGAEVEIKFKLA